MMKNRFLIIIAAAAAVFTTAACKKVAEKEFDPTDPAIMTIKVQPETVSVAAINGTTTVTFTAPDYWFVSSPNSWLTYEPASGKPGEVTLTINGVQNTGEAREAVVTVTSKTQRGQFKVSQEAWPFKTSAWTISGTVNAGKAVEMEDQGDGLAWAAANVPYYAKETFQFQSGSTNVGRAGELVLLEDPANTYQAALTRGGESISLPESGLWNITFDLNFWTIQAVLADRFPWGLVGTIKGGSWTEDSEMEDKGDKLVWAVNRVPYHEGEEFKIRMNGKDAFSLGLSGALTAGGAENTYKGTLAQGGSNITLPAEGYWDLSFDVKNLQMTATFLEEFPEPPLVHEGMFWENSGDKPVEWTSDYRFGLEGNDGNNECIATLPEEVWTKMKTQTFYLVVAGSSPYIRVTNGWWDASWKVGDIQPGNELLKDNGDGTFTLTVNLTNDPDFVASLDQKHILFTGAGFTPLGIYPETTWENPGDKAVEWTSDYRFGLEGNDSNNECIATFPASVWNKLKTGTFRLVITLNADWYQVRVTNGWWDANWKVGDVTPGSELLTDNGDGTYSVTVNLSDDPDFVATLDQKHILFTGAGYTPVKICVEW